MPDADIRYAKGCDIIEHYLPKSELYDVPLDSMERKGIEEAVSLAKECEVADEVVQLYIRDNLSSVTTYTKVLRGFERISLKPEETKIVTFRLTSSDLAIWNIHNEFKVETRTFTVVVGASSENICLTDTFEVTE